MRLMHVLALALLALPLALPPAGAAELRTYQFVPDGSLPYYASCGECGPPVSGARADVAGTFTVMLDEAAGTGSLVALDDQLISYFAVVSTPHGPELDPETPPTGGIIPPYFPALHPPLPGALIVAAGVLRLTFDGTQQTPQGTLITLPRYEISITGTQAVFNMTVPIIDNWITVTNAAAVQIPEPAAILPFLVAAAAIFRRRRR